MPSARREAFFASFLLPYGQKGWRPAVRDEMVSPRYSNRRQCAMMEEAAYHQRRARGDQDEH
jgi:hypothetical protein